MLRRLHPDQPGSFAFTPANQAWAEAQITKYPEGRQASAIIPLLWRAQEQEGWLTRAAIEHVATMLGMAYIRALEVATFYFMFQLQPVGSVANIQICGTTSCMICGAEDLIRVCKEKISPKPHTLSADGKFTWEEVECLGACTNAPMAQIGKDYYEDLTAEGFAKMLDDMAAGKVPVPGPQNGRFASEPLGGPTTLKDYTGEAQNGSVALATRIGDTLKRIDGTEVPLVTPWQGVAAPKPPKGKAKEAKPAENLPVDSTGVSKQEAPATSTAKPEAVAKGAEIGTKPEMLVQAKGAADDLKKIKGVGPKLESLLNSMGVFHFWQVASWGADEVAWVDENLEGFKGRVSRDDWVAQAKILATGGETEFSKR
ncbi:MAG: NADH-quinone oxidoreductase subunit E [Natronohydrobacter sp.]|nr:NADH-quinone oxidoreductase subunit E [Natronohydrobacter sp.]